jgi:hypothetical protein
VAFFLGIEPWQTSDIYGYIYRLLLGSCGLI